MPSEPLRGSIIDVYVIRASYPRPAPLLLGDIYGVFPTRIQAEGFLRYDIANPSNLVISSLKVFKEDGDDRVFFLTDWAPFMLNSDYDPKESEAYVREQGIRAQALAKLTSEEAEVLLRGLK